MPPRILVVDDNRDNLTVYIKTLQRKIKPRKWESTVPDQNNSSGVFVDWADTVPLALHKLKNGLFDILVIDLKIPGSSGDELGGFEVITNSMALDPLRPIIVITGYGSIELAKKTFNRGVFDFIEKSDIAKDELVNAVQKALESREEKVIRYGNPFTTVTNNYPTVFGGRNNELDFFEQKLNRVISAKSSEHFIILGGWGIGKSTLLREYKKVCQSWGHLAAIVPLSPPADTDEAARSIVEGILRNIPFPIERFKRTLEYFNSIGLSVLGSGFQISRNTTKKYLSTQAFLYDSLLSIWHDLEDKTSIFVILLDDLDNFIKVPDVIMTIKQTLSTDALSKTGILMGISSTPECWMTLTDEEKFHPLSRYFLSRIELTSLSENELSDTVLKSLAGTSVSFSSEIIKRVYYYTLGHPFEMQVLCHHLFDNQIYRHVDIDAWDKALQAAIEQIDGAVFSHWIHQLNFEQLKILKIIAQSDNPISASNINISMGLIHKTSIVSKQTLEKYLSGLIMKRYIVINNQNLYFIQDPMFRVYVRTVL